MTAAVLGGYGVSALAVSVLALALSGPLGRADATWLATMSAFVILTGVVVGVFAAPTSRVAWAGLVGAAMVLAALRWGMLS